MSHHHPRVLTIVNEAHESDRINDLLTKHQIRTFSYVNFEQCMDQIKFIRPDVIVLDGKTPSMDGTSVESLIKGDQATHTIPVALLSDSEDSCVHLGENAVIHQPVREDNLMDVINCLMNSTYFDDHI